MLFNAKSLKGFTLHGNDGEVGKVKEFFFDDKFWTVRYLVANTGGWFSNKDVLVSPYFLLNVNFEDEYINVDLNQHEIENSPSWESDKPVSRQYEQSYYDYYKTPIYWSGPYMWGEFPFIMRDRQQWETMKKNDETWDPHLRSTKDVSDYNIQANDDSIGHVEDFIIDDDSWAIRYLVVDTRNFLPGKKVLISPQWIENFNTEDSSVRINLGADVIRDAPEYNEDELPDRDYESRLYQYYNKQGYWNEEPVTRTYMH